MPKFTLIIPVYNLRKRGFERILNSLYSLECQTFKDFRVVVSDGSDIDQWDELHHHMASLELTIPVIHSMVKIPEFNKPVLLNRAMRLYSSPYYINTDADYLFSPDLLHELNAIAREDRYILHKVEMLPKRQPITRERIKAFNIAKQKENPFGNLADGGMQVFHNSWLSRCNGYDERMAGWCGMDNDMTNRAKFGGLEVVWMNTGRILHQWHEIEKHRTNESYKQSQRNWLIRDTDNTIRRNEK